MPSIEITIPSKHAQGCSYWNDRHSCSCVTIPLEIWRPIIGFEKTHEISNLGRVRSVDYQREQPDAWGGITHKSYRGRILKPWLAGAGYPMVALALSRTSRRYVHRLVAEAFLPSPESYQTQINHRNGSKNDNRAVNLEWVSARENQRHATHVLNRRRGQFMKGGGRIA